MNYPELISRFSEFQIFGYVAILFLMIAEGPLTTMFASFAASLGYFNIWIIFVIAFLGDVIGDLIHYSVGFYLRKSLVEKYGAKWGIKKSKIKQLENKLNKNFLAAMIIGKPTAPLSTITLLMSGALRVPLRKFLIVSIITTLPLTILYTSLGFFFGSTLNEIIKYLEIGKYAFILIIISLVILYLIYKIVSKLITRNMRR